MLRIGEFTDTFIPVVDGVGRVVLAYAETLAKMDHHVTVVAPMYDTGYRGGYPFELVDFQSLSLPSSIKQYKVGEATLDAHYLKRMKMIPLDIVHAHSPFTCATEALRLATLRKLPLVGTFHSKYYDDFLKFTKSETLARTGLKMVVDFYERCDEVWAVGQNTADVLHEYGYEGDIIVMPNGSSIREIPKDAVEEAGRRWRLGKDPLFLFVGQMNWKKNILRVLEACAVLNNNGKKFHLVLAGQGPDMKEIEETIYRLGLSSRTSLAGHVTDSKLLDGLYARADLFCFPSLYDNAPMVVREAAVMKTPSVMVRGSSAAEIITDRQNGYLCDDTTESLAAVMQSVLDHPAEARQIGERAYETIPVPWTSIMENVVSRYERLIALGHEGRLKPKQMRIL